MTVARNNHRRSTGRRLSLLLVGLVLAVTGCDSGGGPNPPATPINPGGPVTPPAVSVGTPLPQPTAPPRPTISSAEQMMRDAYEVTKSLPYYQIHYEQTGTGSDDFTLDVAYQAPARAAMTVTQGSTVSYARTINGVVYVQSAAGQWQLLEVLDREAYPLVPQPTDALHIYNLVRGYSWVFRAPYDVQDAGTQTINGVPRAVIRFKVPPAVFAIASSGVGGGITNNQPAPSIPPQPGGTATLWVDPATKQIYSFEMVVNARYLQGLRYPTPTPGGPPATLPPAATTPLPAQATLRYTLTQINVPVDVPNPPGVEAPTYPPGPHPLP